MNRYLVCYKICRWNSEMKMYSENIDSTIYEFNHIIDKMDLELIIEDIKRNDLQSDFIRDVKILMFSKFE